MPVGWMPNIYAFDGTSKARGPHCQPSPCCLLNLRQQTSPDASLQVLLSSFSHLRSLIEVDINWGWDLYTFSSGTVAHSLLSPRSFCFQLPTFVQRSRSRPRVPTKTAAHVISYYQLASVYTNYDRHYGSTGPGAICAELATGCYQRLTERIQLLFRTWRWSINIVACTSGQRASTATTF
jgi:VanZ family protein